jgi:microcystin-dependent protein
MFAGNFAPVDWLLCQGQLLPISQYDVLYTLLGTTYGGDGTQTFALPDLRGRLPIHMSSSNPLGQQSGQETVTLTAAQLPAHTHAQMAQNDKTKTTSKTPTNNFPSAGPSWYTTNAPVSADALASPPTSTVGGSLPHDNMMPFLPINFIIATNGLYPSRN